MYLYQSIFLKHLWDFYNVIVKMLFYGPWLREKRKINTWIRYPGVLWVSLHIDSIPSMEIGQMRQMLLQPLYGDEAYQKRKTKRKEKDRDEGRPSESLQCAKWSTFFPDCIIDIVTLRRGKRSFEVLPRCSPQKTLRWVVNKDHSKLLFFAG